MTDPLTPTPSFAPIVPEPVPAKKQSNFWSELVKLILLAGFVVVPFRMFVAQPFIVDGASMDPTFRTSQYLIVDELSYHFKEPERGSVLIFKYPKDPSKYFIKRIIGLPNEEVRIEEGKVTIVSELHPQGVVLDEPYVEFQKSDSAVRKLGPNEYFVMGDNRAGSSDSRIWGPVPRQNIIGRPIIRAWPLTLWPGDRTFGEPTDLNAENK